MALTPGARLGPYQILSALGAGGMGEVYRARDTRLKRDVALKILPESFAADADRLARFQREAEVLASLNHRNIATIHGFEESGETHALVLEFVEGETLADRIARGPIPLEEALRIAQQICQALEAAHEHGIIHRDLKPANIMLTARGDGTVKVLDFGLAKAVEPASSLPGMSQSPTLTSPAMMSGIGVILGTAAYMSPEQAVGRTADKRSDVWAFGVVLLEMLTGRPVFTGETVSHVLAAVLKSEPDWTTLPAETPTSIRTLLRRCLEKDHKRRLADAADARLEIEEALEALKAGTGAPAPAAIIRNARLPWVVAALATIAALAVVALWAPWRTQTEPARVMFEVQTAYSGGLGPLPMFAISPDGTHLVSRAADGDVDRLWVRPLARLEGATLKRSDGALYPFWSPDGHSLGFFVDGKLKTIDISGSVPRPLADAPSGWGGTWNRDDVILFAPQDGPIYRVTAIGGSVVPVTELDAARGDTSHRFPRFLPDGVHFVYLVISSKPDSGGIYLGSLASKETHRLVDAVNKPEFAPPDLLLFLRESTLMAQRLDTNSAQLIGTALRVVEPVLSDVSRGTAAFSVSDNGVLAYRTWLVDGTLELAWVDRSGKREGPVGPPARYQNPRLSPDGKQLAVFNPENGGDIYLTELASGISSRFTLDPAEDNVPLWSKDGNWIAFVSNRDGGVFNIYRKNTRTGQEDLLLETPYSKTLNDWSRDGLYLLYEEVDAQMKTDVWMLPLIQDRGRFVPGKARPLLDNPSFNESQATLSPDADWMAYISDHDGSRQLYVQKFPTPNRPQRVSTGASAGTPRWGLSGKELFFDITGTMMSVDVTKLVSGGELGTGMATRLFNGLTSVRPHNFDVNEEGRFLVLLAPGAVTGDTAPITVVVNWKTGLSLGR